jgi:hypothetical protein
MSGASVALVRVGRTVGEWEEEATAFCAPRAGMRFGAFTCVHLRSPCQPHASNLQS